MPRKEKPKKEVAFDTWLISGLRRLCMRWPPYYSAKNRCKLIVNLTKVHECEDFWVAAGVDANGSTWVIKTQHNPKLGKRTVYRCEQCRQLFLDKDYYTYKNGKRKKRSTMVVDHIEPVCGPEGRTTWDSYIERMFPQGAERPFQCICRACHQLKNEEENNERRQRKAKDNNSKKASIRPKKDRGGK